MTGDTHSYHIGNAVCMTLVQPVTFRSSSNCFRLHKHGNQLLNKHTTKFQAIKFENISSCCISVSSQCKLFTHTHVSVIKQYNLVR